MKEAIARILQSDLGPPAKLMAIAIACGVSPVTSESTGLSHRSIERHLADAQELVRELQVEAPAPAPTKKREVADPARWLAEQERDLAASRAGVKPLHRS
jgi:hypothetical protein